jgi:hypothetical protein
VDDGKERVPLWTGLALGIGIAALLGVGILIVFALRRRDQPLLVGYTPSSYAPPMQGAGFGYAPLLAPPPPSMAFPQARALAPPPIEETRLRTFTLPILAPNTQAVQIAQAGPYPAKIVARPLGPAGTFAVLGDSAELQAATPTAFSGYLMGIPSGQSQEIQLRPHQILFAKGSAAGVVLSVATAEATTRATA